MAQAFHWQNPSDHENEITVAMVPVLRDLHRPPWREKTGEQALCITVADEKAVDSYNATFECEIELPLNMARQLRNWLNIVVKD